MKYHYQCPRCGKKNQENRLPWITIGILTCGVGFLMPTSCGHCNAFVLPQWRKKPLMFFLLLIIAATVLMFIISSADRTTIKPVKQEKTSVQNEEVTYQPMIIYEVPPDENIEPPKVIETVTVAPKKTSGTSNKTDHEK